MHTTDFQYIQSSQKSHIFLAHYSPKNCQVSPDKAKAIILVPPFAEEMNRSKRMYVLCARLLANAGFHVISFDYSGTGDSSDEWGEFEYQDWVNDLIDVYHYTKKIAVDVNFIALRFGVFVLADAIVGKHVTASKCILWDPIETGEILTRQLVRMKIASTLTDASRKITTKDVMEDMRNTGFLESAGYRITYSMFEEIATKKLANEISQILEQVSVHWMMLGKFREGESKWLANSFKESDLKPNTKRSLLTMHPVNDVKFWMQQEVTISPKLLQQTNKVFATGE